MMVSRDISIPQTFSRSRTNRYKLTIDVENDPQLVLTTVVYLDPLVFGDHRLDSDSAENFPDGHVA